MQPHKIALYSLLAIAGAACGGATTSDSGSSAVTGTAGGAPVRVTDSVGLIGTESVGGIPVAYAGALLTNLSGACGLLQRKANPASATGITLVVATRNPAVRPGSYPLANANGTDASVAYFADNAMCATTANEKATSGTITITQADAATVAGTFDATFANGDHVAGSFSAPVCAVDVSQLSSNAPCGS
jgi:hypothetical protein